MDARPADVEETREFEFVLRFESGADELMDVFRRYESLSLWSSAIFTNDTHMWRLDHAKGTADALEAFNEVFLDGSRCNECFDVTDCDTGREYHVLSEEETSQTVYTLRREIENCHSVPYFVRNHIQEGTVFESRRVGHEYRWRVLYPGTRSIGDVYDRVEAHLRDGVSIAVSHVTGAGKWNATERAVTDLSPAHWRALKAAVNHGYYERPREVSVADLAALLDDPRSTVQYRLRTAEDRIITQFVKQIT
ncbi:helix-turn-helix domain-containing protein [Halorubrum salinum]|uniref:helix-turn-helix domain-containing protein n=1 Tax=Halorubrum salinum TaxID=767517 RepID=UPI002110E7A9|nr:helix-turn-helix domain-containing protein [Halorubrum salinum]